MTPVEAFDVLMLLRVGLPNAYLKLTEADTDAMVTLWAEMFRDYPAGDVMAAAQAYIWQDTTGRFPSPGIIHQILDGVQEAISHYSCGADYLLDWKKYPPPARDYIEAKGRAEYEKRTGLPFRPYIERLAEETRNMLADGRTGS